MTGLFGLVVSYTNCSQVGNIQVKDAVNSVADTQQEPSSPTTVTDIIASCDKAMRAGKLLTLNQKVNFEDSRIETGKKNICEFSIGGSGTTTGNLEMAQERLQARYEQDRMLQLPANAIICNVDMQNGLQKFRYDDVFFFTLNGFLLASNDKTAVQDRLTAQSVKLSTNQFTDIYTYDWMKLRTAGFKNEADDYCAGVSEGLSSCQWPISEQQGDIKFSFSQSLLISMTAGVKSDQQKFSFVITGDDDPTLDCYHEKLEFNMIVKYFVPQ